MSSLLSTSVVTDWSCCVRSMAEEKAEMTMAEALKARKALRDARKRERGELFQTSNDRPTKKDKKRQREGQKKQNNHQKRTLAAKEHLAAENKREEKTLAAKEHLSAENKRQKKTLAVKEHLAAVDSLAQEAAQFVHAMAASGVAQQAGAAALHDNDLVQILWPPMLVLRGIAENSSGKLLRRFPTASHAFPVYNRTFQGSAVLVFESDDDEHTAGYERAKAVASTVGAAFATWRDGLTWCTQAWAWKLCKRVVGWQKTRPALADGGCPELIGSMVQMQLGANQGQD